ncbi:MAG: hypothetical protein J7501_02660 [Bdellovibrio sp.]|nr:hypothetical protein [Bdellovibrio sp.]
MLSFLALILAAPVFAQQKVNVKNFYPEGSHRSVDQLRIEFAQPQVKLGEFKTEAPAQSACLKGGQGRWVDTRNWVYDFNPPLGGGRICEVNVSGQVYRFNTGGPHVKTIFPRTYRPIDSEQNFLVFMDSEVRKESLPKAAYFVIEGLGDRIPAEVIAGAEAEKVRANALEEYRYEKDDFKGSWVVLKSSRIFPAGAKVSLVWSKEIESPQGFRSTEDETFEFQVENAFKADFSCEREAPGKPCIPILPMRMSFTNPVLIKALKQIYIESSSGKKVYASDLAQESEKESKTYLEFKGPFSAKSQYKLFVPAGLKDDQGHELMNRNQFPIAIQTGDDPSLLKFAADFGIIEEGKNSAIPVTLRRVEKSLATSFAGWSGRLGATNFKDIISYLGHIQRNPTGGEKIKFHSSLNVQKIKVDKPLAAADTEVVGIPLKKSGFYVVEMESRLLGQSLLNENVPFYVRTAALVTKMAVHAKFSKNEVWVWVTDLKTAQPVAGAAVKVVDVKGAVQARGTSDAKGLALLKLSKNTEELPRNEEGPYYDGFFVVAENGDDFTFTHSSWDRGIESWRYQIAGGVRASGLIAHAILDRTLLKPEETLSAKIVVRKTAKMGLELPVGNEWPTTLEMAHDSGLQTLKFPLTWDKKSGTALWQWMIPPGAKLGRWVIRLTGTKNMYLEAGDVRIENFRVPLLQVRLQSNKPQFVEDKSIPLSVIANYFSGGPAAKMPMKIRWSVEPGSFNVQDDDFQEYMFANGAIKEGLFRSGDEENARYIPQSGVKDVNLDKAGSASFVLEPIKYSAGPQRLRVEGEYKDPNGEIQSTVRSYPLWSSDIVLGIKADGWSATPDKVRMNVVAFNLAQEPLKNQKVKVDLYTSRYYSHRKRLVGGFYAYEDFQEVKKVGKLCEGTTDKTGQFKCIGKTSAVGSVIAVVSSQDSQGRPAQANVNQWVVADGESQWFGSQDNDRADLVPFKKSYEPGETAELQLRTPFQEAKVLVTVERDSVLYREVIDVKGENPVIRIPIKKEYAPNVVISAFAIRGRLNDPKPTALVDLGKPSFKLGLSEIKVGWKANTLKVQVETDRKTYRAREKALVKIKVVDADGKPAPSGQVALVAVDEGLLELRDNSSWDLLSAMMGLRQYDVRTATAQSFIIGKRHFGLKAVPIGGDGRSGLRRELFDTLLYWNPKVQLDKQGQAQLSVQLNDSTTSFRIVAVAQQGKEQFGTGWTSVQSTQDVMILPGLSGVTRKGDEFMAGFTVRNASLQKQRLTVSLHTTPSLKTGARTIELEPGASQLLSWNLKIPDVDSFEYVVTARDIDGKVQDEIKKTQKVLSLRQPHIYQSEFGQWPDFKNIAVRIPENAEPDSSTVVVEASSLLGGQLTGMKEFWKNYSYTCLEQQVSRAVSLNDQALWKKIEQKFGTYQDERGLLKFFPSSYARGDIALTSYVLSVAHEAGFKISEDTENKMLDALASYGEGRLKDVDGVGRVDEVIKKISAFEALSRYRRLNVDLLSTITYQGNQWPLSSLVEWYNILNWESKVPQRDQKVKETESILRNKFYFSAKRLMLKEEGLDVMPWLMRDGEGASLRLISAVMNKESWQGDLPRLMQGILMRQREGAWALTTSNAWGRLALKKFDQKFQNQKVTGLFKAQIGSQQRQGNWEKASSQSFEFPLKEKASTVILNQEGTGKPWITVSSKASIPVTKPFFAGFSVEKKITALEQKSKGRWSVGDTVKIELTIKAQAPQTWVVVNDPIPAGASVLQSSWATAIERKEELMRFYLSWLPQEMQTLEYTLRFNQVGIYKVPATRVEAMYSPDLYAELPETTWTVSE